MCEQRVGAGRERVEAREKTDSDHPSTVGRANVPSIVRDVQLLLISSLSQKSKGEQTPLDKNHCYTPCTDFTVHMGNAASDRIAPTNYVLCFKNVVMYVPSYIYRDFDFRLLAYNMYYAVTHLYKSIK